MQQSRQRSANATASSAQSSMSGQLGADASGDLSLAAAGPAPRDRNLPFRFAERGLDGIKPATLAKQVQSAMFAFGADGEKDGASLSDPERLYLVVQTMSEGGASDVAIEAAVANVFFDRGGPNSGRDLVDSVTYSPGDQVRVTFRSSGGYGFNAGGIIDMIATPPVAYSGQDTNRRGNAVRSFQDGTIARTGSWLQTQQGAIVQGFLNSNAGKLLMLNSPGLSQTDPAFRAALWDFEQDLGISYLIMAPAWIQTQIGDTKGMSQQQIIDRAVMWASQYANPNLFAVAHPGVLQIQDEAAAQIALKNMGINANIDTDRY